MEFAELLRRRRSIRCYDLNRPVGDRELEQIAQAVRLAPSACNLQPFRILALRGGALKKSVAEACRQDFPRQAPVLLVFIGDGGHCWKRGDGFESLEVDAGIALEHASLAAADLGLGSCWIGAFDRSRADAALDLSAPFRTVAMMTLGYPAEEPRPFSRKESGELFEVVD